MTMHRKGVSGWLVGSIAGAQEVLDLCAEDGIGPDIQIIRIQDINKAYQKVEEGGVRFPHVIDMALLGSEAHDGSAA